MADTADGVQPQGVRRGPAQPLPAAEAPFDAIGLARHLLRGIRSGALATLDAQDGMPFASLVTIATDIDGTPVMLLSRLSAHTRNLLADPRARERFLARHPKAKLYADFPDFGFFTLSPEAGHLNGGFAKAATLTAS